MGRPDVERELYISQKVAEGLNARDGSDYRAASPVGSFPDAVLVSASGEFTRRSVEVTSVPSDPTIRSDNKNRRKFENVLKECLKSLGHTEGQVTVHWSDGAVLHGVRRDLLELLAAIIADQTETIGSIRGENFYAISPELCSAVNYVSWGRIPGIELQIASPFSFWSPRDGVWLHEAIRRKQLHRAADLILAIDGGAHIDSEQIEALCEMNANENSGFSEIWVVNFTGAHQLFPAVKHQ